MSTATKTYTLSKSTFIRGCKCLKSLYLYKHHYDWRDETSNSQQAIFDQGHQIGLLARSLFPGGIDCSVEPAYDYNASVQKTTEALKSGASVYYEPEFLYNNVYAAVDILVVKEDGWYVYEVKSSTSVKDYHYMDAAIQLYILRQLQLPVRAVHVVHINNQYVRKGDVKPAELFNITEVTAEATEQQPFINEQLPVMFNVLNSGSIPNMEIGPQCSKYYGCDYESYCWKMFEDVEFPVYTISRIGDKQWDLIKQGLFCQTQLPGDFKLTENQKVQVRANQTKTSPAAKVAAVKDFLSGITYPIGFLDFESFNAAVPLFDDTRPYQQVPFQYSLHYLHEDDIEEHVEFLGDGKTDPRKALVEKMIADLQKAQTILCYNLSFEKGRIEELMELYPEYEKQLEAVITKLVDLIVPFRKKYVYHYKMNGSASIKDVLPALIPDLSYATLEIKEGGSASHAYLSLLNLSLDEEMAKTRKALQEYCKMDTYAMVRLFQYLKQICI